MRQTIGDIARAARVSTATVDRVLNERQGVRGLTRARVLEAARAIGYLPDIEPGPAKRAVRLDFVLQSGPNTFMDLLASQLMAVGAARSAEVDVHVHRVDGFSAEALAASLREHAGATGGIGIIAIDHPLVREAILEVTAAGTPILTLVSDIAQAPRIAYVGIDNRNAGRLAGHLLGRFVPGSVGEVALFAGSLSYRGHEEREMGFRHILADDFPRLRIVELREVRDDLEHSYHEASSPACRPPGLARHLQYRRR